MTRTALLFPGQGAQRPGMGAELAKRSPAAAEVFRRASESLGWDVLETCQHGSMDQLTRGDVAQPAIVAIGLATYQHVTTETDVRPDFMAGHSLGEITALACSGVFDLELAVRLAQVRGRLMREAASNEPGAMCAILGLPLSEVARACAEHDHAGSRVVISNENAFDQFVISGHRHAVDAVCRTLITSGAKIRPIEVEGAFHSPLMAGAAKQFGSALAEIEMREPAVPVLSTVTARPHTRSSAIPILLKRQVVERVRWRSCFEFLAHAGVKLFLESGPGNVLTRLARRTGSAAEAFSLDECGDCSVNPNRLKKTADATHFMEMCLAAAAATPNLGTVPEAFHRDAAPAYRELEQLRLTVLEARRVPAAAELSRCLELAERILECKRAPGRLAELRSFAEGL